MPPLGSLVVVLAMVAGPVWLAGCASTAPAPSGPQVSTADAEYLISPLEGFPHTLDPGTAQAVEGAWRELRSGGAPAQATAVADRLLASEPDLDAAQVLKSQASLVDGSYAEVIEEMLAVTQRTSAYRAAQLLLGRAAELAGELPVAQAAYRATGAGDEVARRAAQRTAAGALEMLAEEVSGQLASGRIGTAASSLDRMREIDPDAVSTLRAALAVGGASGDRAVELEAARSLASRFPEESDLALRHAVLEVEVGDTGAGLRILQQLAAAAPDDPVVAEELARARFRWRLELLPKDVQAIVRGEEISRADFAALLYWLVPAVRYGPAGGGRIATDILDHPRKEEIIRVVNLGLMEVDPGLHQFAPNAPLRRLGALNALLRLMAANDPPAGCLGGRTLGPAPSARGVCEAAVRCGLIDADTACFPGAPVDGEWAVEAGRQALNELGI